MHRLSLLAGLFLTLILFCQRCDRFNWVFHMDSPVSSVFSVPLLDFAGLNQIASLFFGLHRQCGYAIKKYLTFE